jgi:hypothetical protein
MQLYVYKTYIGCIMYILQIGVLRVVKAVRCRASQKRLALEPQRSPETPKHKVWKPITTIQL